MQSFLAYSALVCLMGENWFQFIFKHGKPLHVIWSVGVVGFAYEKPDLAIASIWELVAKNYRFTMAVS
jgi:hypothetical protein